MTSVESSESSLLSDSETTSEDSSQADPPPFGTEVPLESAQGLPLLNDDVLRRIIELAVSPRTDLAFVYEPSALQTLLTLMLVSWRLHNLARPFLYRRMRLATRQQVELLVRRNFAGDLPVRYLTVEGTAVEHPAVWSFIRNIGQTLERTFMVDPGQSFLNRCRYKWPDFATQFPRLWENSNTFRYPFLLDISGTDPPVPVPVPPLPYLRRQATLRLGHHFFTPCWQTLEYLATVSDDRINAKHFHLLIDLHPKLREIVIIINPDHHDRYFADEYQVLKQEYAHKYEDRLSFYDVIPKLGRASLLEAWFAEAVRRGTLWTMERKNWLSYSSQA